MEGDLNDAGCHTNYRGVRSLMLWPPPEVVKELESIDDNQVTFKDGKTQRFNAIIFVTGYKRTARNWLREDIWLLNNAKVSESLEGKECPLLCGIGYEGTGWYFYGH